MIEYLNLHISVQDRKPIVVFVAVIAIDNNIKLYKISHIVTLGT